MVFNGEEMLNKFKFIIFIVFAAALTHCGNPDPNELVNEAIKNSGWHKFKNNDIEYDFRGIHYKVFHNNGLFVYEKIYLDTTQGIIREGMTNDSTYKELNGLEILLDEQQKKKIRSSINQVVYFNLLPYKLNDAAVIKRFAGTSTINGKNYYKVKVTFNETGGGDDYNDWFLYWFDKNTKSMDYFAYYYHTNGGSSRFRVIKQQHLVNGFTFYDWENFTSDEVGDQIENYEKLFQEGKLKKVSDIELKNIEVEEIKK